MPRDEQAADNWIHKQEAIKSLNRIIIMAKNGLLGLQKSESDLCPYELMSIHCPQLVQEVHKLEKSIKSRGWRWAERDRRYQRPVDE